MGIETPLSGQIAMSDVNLAEPNSAYNAQISLNDTEVRYLAGLTTTNSQISLTNLYGKNSVVNASLPSNTNYFQLNVRTWAVNNGWDQNTAYILTIPAGVYVWTNSTSVPAMTVNGSWPNGITIVNNGYIMGQGGSGGGASSPGGSGSGTSGWESTSIYEVGASSGGPAMSLGVSVTIDSRNGFIGGGGGGGQGFYGINNIYNAVTFGMGGGGGAGGGTGGPGWAAEQPPGSGGLAWGSPVSGGAGGSLGANGGNAVIPVNSPWGPGRFGSAGGGGGRVIPGSTTNANTSSPDKSDSSWYIYYGIGGSAGGSGGATSYSSYSISGGAGGGAGQTGGTGVGSKYGFVGGGGGGWGAAGGQGSSGMTGSTGYSTVVQGPGQGGYAIQLNGYGVTWVGGSSSTNNVYGTVG